MLKPLSEFNEYVTRQFCAVFETYFDVPVSTDNVYLFQDRERKSDSNKKITISTIYWSTIFRGDFFARRKKFILLNVDYTMSSMALNFHHKCIFEIAFDRMSAGTHLYVLAYEYSSATICYMFSFSSTKQRKKTRSHSLMYTFFC